MSDATELEDRTVVELASSVEEVSAQEWDAALAEGDLYHSHAWLRALDRAQGPAETLMARVDGRFVGGLPLWRPAPGTNGLFHLPSYFPDVPGPWQEPFLWGGGRRSVRNTLPIVDGVDDGTLRRHLLLRARDLAAQRGYVGMVVPFLPAGVAGVVRDAVPEAQVMAHDAEAIVDVPPGGTRELVAAGVKRDRSKRRGELAAFLRDGGEATVAPVTSELVAQAAPLIAQTRERYGGTQGTEYVHAQLTAQQQCGVLEHAVAFLSHYGDALTAVSIGYVQESCLYSRYFGADYTRERPSYDYFVIGYDTPIDYAADRGLRRYLLATSALDTKVRRGAQLAPLLAAVLLTDGQTPPEAAARAHDAAFAQSFHARYERRPAVLGADWDLLA